MVAFFVVAAGVVYSAVDGGSVSCVEFQHFVCA